VCRADHLALGTQQHCQGTRRKNLHGARSLANIHDYKQGIVKPVKTVYPFKSFPDVIQKMVKSQIAGRAVVRFDDTTDE
jgi:CBS domain-containing protein